MRFAKSWMLGGDQLVVRYRPTVGDVTCSVHVDGLWQAVDTSSYDATVRLHNMAAATTAWSSVSIGGTPCYGLHGPVCIRILRAPAVLKVQQ